GTILHYNGSAWTASSSGTTNAFFGVWAASSADAWAVGQNATLLHYNGTNWSTATWPGSAAQIVNGVWGIGPADVWAVGSNGLILHYNGTAWSAVASGVTWFLFSAWGKSSCALRSVRYDTSASRGTILHYAGASCQPRAR